MRKRNVPILFRLNKKEAELLDKRVKTLRPDPRGLPAAPGGGLCPEGSPAAGLLRYDAGALWDRAELKPDRTEGAYPGCHRHAAV